MTLRNRVSVAAAVGVLIVVAAVSSVMYLFYAASLHSRSDAALVDAAMQASGDARRIKQAGAGGKRALDFAPVTVGSVQIQLFTGPVAAGQPTQFGPLDSRDVAVAEHLRPAYFANARHDGQQFRVYTAILPIAPGGGLVRTSQAGQHLLPSTGGSLDVRFEQCVATGDCPQALVQQILNKMRQFALCMRSHGVPNWPDPTIGRGGLPFSMAAHTALTIIRRGSGPKSANASAWRPRLCCSGNAMKGIAVPNPQRWHGLPGGGRASVVPADADGGSSAGLAAACRDRVSAGD